MSRQTSWFSGTYIQTNSKLHCRLQSDECFGEKENTGRRVSSTGLGMASLKIK